MDEILNELEQLKKRMRSKEKLKKDEKENEMNEIKETIKELSKGIHIKLSNYYLIQLKSQKKIEKMQSFQVLNSKSLKMK